MVNVKKRIKIIGASLFVAVIIALTSTAIPAIIDSNTQSIQHGTNILNNCENINIYREITDTVKNSEENSYYELISFIRKSLDTEDNKFRLSLLNKFDGIITEYFSEEFLENIFPIFFHFLENNLHFENMEQKDWIKYLINDFYQPLNIKGIENILQNDLNKNYEGFFFDEFSNDIYHSILKNNDNFSEDFEIYWERFSRDSEKYPFANCQKLWSILREDNMKDWGETAQTILTRITPFIIILLITTLMNAEASTITIPVFLMYTAFVYYFIVTVDVWMYIWEMEIDMILYVYDYTNNEKIGVDLLEINTYSKNVYEINQNTVEEYFTYPIPGAPNNDYMEKGYYILSNRDTYPDEERLSRYLLPPPPPGFWHISIPGQWVEAEYYPANYIETAEILSSISYYTEIFLHQDHPYIFNEFPTSGSENIDLNPLLSVEVIDYQGDSIDIAFEILKGVNWQEIEFYEDSFDGKYYASTQYFNSYETEYQWRVKVIDQYGNDEMEIYSFTTMSNE